MNASYRILFTINLLHEYYADNKCQALEIIPTNECAAICKKMNIQVRSYENKLHAFIRENDAHEPYLNTDTDKSYHKYYDKTVFRFYARLLSPDFLNYTNLEYNYNNSKILYFSNLANN